MRTTGDVWRRWAPEQQPTKVLALGPGSVYRHLYALLLTDRPAQPLDWTGPRLYLEPNLIDDHARAFSHLHLFA
jgi:hypothetical protein